jgi:hypothetical protein
MTFFKALYCIKKFASLFSAQLEVCQDFFNGQSYVAESYKLRPQIIDYLPFYPSTLPSGIPN